MPKIDLTGQRSRGLVDGTQASVLKVEMYAHNTSGIKGVKLNKRTGKWVAHIQFKKIQYHLGTYTDKLQAAEIRKEVEEMLFEPFLEWYQANIANDVDKGENL